MAIKAPANCLAKHVKLNPATGDVAIRTIYDDVQFPKMSWLIATSGTGAQNASHAEVNGWTDLVTPTPPALGD